ncbi:MAG TPA: FxsA family protein [Candidatus Thermoplasmatota archaeon]|nr:FxsA family protein [Candidatus Thermoplasmatota archaeon]
MRWTLLVLFVGVPAADIALDVALVKAFGLFAVFTYLVVAALLGLVVLRYAGPITLVRATARVQKGQTPGRELVDGILLLAGGLYLLFPGPVSDALAVMLVTPGLRKLPRWWLARAFFGNRSSQATTTEGGPVDVDEYRVE